MSFTNSRSRAASATEDPPPSATPAKALIFLAGAVYTWKFRKASNVNHKK
jgi:hypothetical protein